MKARFHRYRSLIWAMALLLCVYVGLLIFFHQITPEPLHKPVKSALQVVPEFADLDYCPPSIPKTILWQEGNFLKRTPFYKQLADLGLPTNRVHTVIDLLTPVYDFRKSHPDHRWQMGFCEGRPERFSLRVSPVEIYEIHDLQGKPKLFQPKVEVVRQRDVIQGQIEGSLFGALGHVEGHPQLAMKLANVFAWDIDFYKDPRKGDRIEILVEKKFIRDGQELRFFGYGPILAARYQGRSESFDAFRFTETATGEGNYYNKEGKSLIRDVLRAPLKLQRITSTFKKKRYHPILKRHRPHNGVDYGAPKNTPIMAVASGTVVRASRYGGAGLAVEIKHKNHMLTQYFHLNKFGRGVRSGSRVKQGQVIGYVGKTGLATSYHLHFGMKIRGKYVNPLRQKFRPGTPIKKDQKGAFQGQVAHYLKRLDQAFQEPEVVPLVKLELLFEAGKTNSGMGL